MPHLATSERKRRIHHGFKTEFQALTGYAPYPWQEVFDDFVPGAETPDGRRKLKQGSEELSGKAKSQEKNNEPIIVYVLFGMSGGSSSQNKPLFVKAAN